MSWPLMHQVKTTKKFARRFIEVRAERGWEVRQDGDHYMFYKYGKLNPHMTVYIAPTGSDGGAYIGMRPMEMETV